ncbi:MAG: hypothetical protein IH851_03975 [Armatimonadetes bacterium]|nr:hypothetical protein [Armatimonadota bacterium]
MKRGLALTAILAMASAAVAADKEVENLLANMRTAYNSVKSASLTVNMLLFTAPGQGITLNIKMEYVKSNRVRAELEATGGMSANVYCDGTTVTVIESRFNQRSVKKFSIDSLNAAMPANLETFNFWDWKRQLSTGVGGNMKDSQLKIVKKQNWNGKEWTVLEETAPDAGVFVQYYIDPKTHFIWRTVVKRLESGALFQDVRITRLELGAKIDPERFKAPDGS